MELALVTAWFRWECLSATRLGQANGSVGAADLGFVKSQSGVAVGAGNFRADIAINGAINAGDVGLVKSKSGNSLPP